MDDLEASQAPDIGAVPQLGCAIGKQQGPDGQMMVSLHLGTSVMSVAVVIPAEGADEWIESVSKDFKKAARECRLSNKGIELKLMR